MFLLQTSIFGDRWDTVAENTDRQTIEEVRRNIRILPMTMTRVVRKCLNCKEENEVTLLSQFYDSTICPNCSQKWE